MVEINAKESGKVIQSKRKALGMTGEDFAEYLDVSIDLVRVWECGKRIPRVQYLVEMSELFKCPIDEMIVRAGCSNGN